MLTDWDVIQRLWDLGHFFSPEVLKLGGVLEKDLPILSVDDAVVREALKSIQSFMPVPFSVINAKLGNTITGNTGTLDEATRLLMETPRCGHPDYVHPDAMKAVGSGSWPEPCQKAGVKVHINTSRMPSQIQISAVKADVFAAYAAVGLKLVEVPTAEEANIQVYWTSLPGSTIGLAEFNNGSCRDQVFCRLDTNYAGYMRSLLAHEMGHNCNLQHTRGGIMNPSVTPDISPFRWSEDDPSYKTLVRFFGGTPITPVPVPTPDPVPTPVPPTGYWTLKPPIKLTDADGKEFNLIPWPRV